MKLLSCFLSLALLGAVSAEATIVRKVEKTFAVQPGGLLTIETQGGDVTVRPGAGDKVKVVAIQKIRAHSDAEADELLQKLQLEMTQSGNDVTATAKYEKRSWGVHFGSWPPVQVGFEVTVPANYNTKLNTSGGDIEIGDLTGDIRAHTSGGNLIVGSITGLVAVSTSGGDVRLKQASGETQLKTSGGDVEVGRVIGATEVSTSGGDISVDSVEGSLRAHTSGGDVAARFIGALQGDCSLSTSGGDVKVVVSDETGFNLDASTSAGEVEVSGLTIKIERGAIGKSRLSGAVNGGGPQLKLRTSGGGIEVRAR